MPKVANYSDVRANLKAYCDEVAEGGEPVVIVRRGRADVALVSLDELLGLEETAHLLRSPATARRLAEALEEVRGGRDSGLSLQELARRLGEPGDG